jgi:protein SCO1/2
MPSAPLPRRALLLVLTVALAACGHEPLPVLGEVPDFALVDQDGTAVEAADLEGSPWVADFVFTRCPDVCPALTATMKGLERDLAARKAPEDPDVTLVSISVDPTHDTPPVLREYAARFGTGPRWRFLTGSRDAVTALVKEGFKLGVADDGPPTAPITHSDRFVLVDGRRRIRGYYRSREPEELARLGDDVRRLSDEAS